MTSTHRATLSQRQLTERIPTEVKNLIRTQNLDKIRDVIRQNERIAEAGFRQGNMNMKQLSRMFDTIDKRIEKYEEDLVKEAVKVIPFKKGGRVKKTSVAVLHKGEKVIPASAVKPKSQPKKK